MEMIPMEKRLALIGYFVLELIFDRAVMGPPAHPGKRKTELNRKGFTGCGKTRCGPAQMIGRDKIIQCHWKQTSLASALNS
jgi:hypothetical protein